MTSEKEEHLPPQRLEKIPNTAGVWSRRNSLLSETEIILLLETKASNQEAASDRRAVKEDELHAELEQQVSKGQGGAGSATCSSWQLADQRRAQLQQRFADLAVHLAQRQLKNLR